MKNIFRKVLIPLLVCILVSSALAEVSLRVVGRYTNLPSYWSYQYLELLNPVKNEKGWRLHRENLDSTFYNLPFKTNSLGIRSAEVDPYTAKKNILWLGSSVAMGWGVPEGERVSDLLEKSFTDHQFINAGVAGHRMSEHFETLDYLASRLKLSGVVLFFNPGDLARTKSRVPQWSRHSFFFSLLMSTLESLFPSPQDSMATTPEMALSQIAQFCKEKGLPFTLIVPPDLNPLASNHSPGDIIRLIKEMELNSVVIPFDELRESSDPKFYWINSRDPHGNSNFQKKVVDQILQRNVVFSPTEFRK